MKKPFMGLSNSKIECLINEWIPSEQYRAIVKRKLIDDVKFEKIAWEFELTPGRVKVIVKEAKEWLMEKGKSV